ncbi:MAG: hypothetical protein ACRDH5_07020 [bacterium]
MVPTRIGLAQPPNEEERPHAAVYEVPPPPPQGLPPDRDEPSVFQVGPPKRFRPGS